MARGWRYWFGGVGDAPTLTLPRRGRGFIGLEGEGICWLLGMGWIGRVDRCREGFGVGILGVGGVGLGW